MWFLQKHTENVMNGASKQGGTLQENIRTKNTFKIGTEELKFSCTHKEESWLANLSKDKRERSRQGATYLTSLYAWMSERGRGGLRE